MLKEHAEAGGRTLFGQAPSADVYANPKEIEEREEEMKKAKKEPKAEANPPPVVEPSAQAGEGKEQGKEQAIAIPEWVKPSAGRIGEDSVVLSANGKNWKMPKEREADARQLGFSDRIPPKMPKEPKPPKAPKQKASVADVFGDEPSADTPKIASALDALAAAIAAEVKAAVAKKLKGLF